MLVPPEEVLGEKYITLRLVYYLSHGGTISVDVWGDI